MGDFAMSKGLAWSVTAFFALCASLSILSIIASAYDYSYGLLLIGFIEAYTSIVVLFSSPIIDCALSILKEYLNLSLNVHDSTKHILVLIGLYISRNITNNLWQRPRHALILVFPAAFLTLFGAIGFGILALIKPALSIIPYVMAFVLFEYIEALLLSQARYRPAGQTFNETFYGYYLPATIWPRVIAGAVVALAALLAVEMGPPEQAQAALLLLPIAYLLMLSSILLWRGLTLANQKSREGENWSKSFFKSNNTRVFILLMEVFVGAGLLFMVDWLGLKPLGF